MSELLVVDLGTLPYATALELQRGIARRRISGDVSEDVLLFVEHPPVVTLGRSAKEAHLVASPELLASQGVERFDVERGGDITFHGPGQLVGYPIIDLKHHKKDLHWYLRQVEEALIRTLAELGIEAGRFEKHTGVWVGTGSGKGEAGSEIEVPGRDSPLAILDSRRKIASIGVHARDWVTWHGFALNVNTELQYFDLIIPCGIQGVTMTSVARELQTGSVDMRTVREIAARAFGAVFELSPRWTDSAELGALPPVHAAAQ